MDSSLENKSPQLSFTDLGVMTPKVYSVYEIVCAASAEISQRFNDVWVEGEVSNLRRPSSGHCYFTLKDDKAQLAVVMFRSVADKLPFKFEDGQLLRCWGRLCIYELQGRFQLTAERAEPVGLGALQLAFEQLKRKLAAEGLFDPARKKAIPFLPRHLAIVTSPTGAALQDMLRILSGRYPVRVTICPAAVQGTDAEPQLVAALARADRLGADVIIIGRGGGSLEDLWAFNTEGVARAIAATTTPIISAVGHEIDVTISDLVADLRAPTPTAAAQLAVPLLADLLERHQVLMHRLERASRQLLRARRDLLTVTRHRLGTPQDQINRYWMRFDELLARLSDLIRNGFRVRRRSIHELHRRLSLHHPQIRIGRHRSRLVALSTQLETIQTSALTGRRAALARYAASLEALSPLAILARGYSVVFAEGGEILRDAAVARIGQPVDIRLHRGALHCVVDRVSPDNKAK